jgi:transposase
MGSKKDLTEGQRSSIVYGYLRGDSVRQIAALVGCGKTAAGNIINKFRKSGASAQEKKKKRPGRPSSLTSTDREILKDLVTEGNRRLSLSQITNLFALQKKKVSESTVRRALHNENLRSCVARPKPLVSPTNVEKRLNWARAHEGWTVRRFRRILWSDETTIRLFQASRCRVWREPHEKWDMECLSSTVNHSQGRMYWGCFSWFGVGPLVPLMSSATGMSHVEILREYVVPFLKEYPAILDRGRPVFQQDNARPHTAKVAREFIEENRVRIMDWPPQSPDLNPIENLWFEVKNAVRRKPEPSNLRELDVLVQEAWYEIPPELCRQLIVSMPDRVAACLKAAGGPTKY